MPTDVELHPDAFAGAQQDWIESLEDALRREGPDFVRQLMRSLQIHAQRKGVTLPVTSQTPYLNTIPPQRQPNYPGNIEIERRIKSIIRWNAMAMVVRANKASGGNEFGSGGVGGHISTYASAATLYEVGYNHFFRGRDHECGGDHVYFQGHASPGPYSRAYVEGRLSETNLINFRRELSEGGGLSSYPHPWLMPGFWEYPTVSMGLGPIMSIYRARFMRYLDDRGLQPYKGAKVWAFVGDGETDEPETLGAISLAAREKLDNLVWVINCNLQRLDGPVRGNGKIIQELEAVFRGTGWNVVKCLWGSDWDPLFEQDRDQILASKLESIVDGEYQKLRVEGGAYIREKVFGDDDRLKNMISHLSDDQLWHLKLGGHDPKKVHAAYKAAVEHEGAPTVILAKTIKGYGLGEAGESRNIAHNAKKMNEEELLAFRDRFNIPLTNEEVIKAPFYRPPDDSIEMQYIKERRAAMGNSLPERRVVVAGWDKPDDGSFNQFDEGTKEGKTLSTTDAVGGIIRRLARDKAIGENIVPIIPDEARTFGMDPMFRQVGIYSHVGQLYDPVDSKQIAFYREATDGQLLEEGINEAGAMCSFIAAGTSHSAHRTPMIPFYIYYSMFGFQRVGDLVWCAGDMRTRGFMIGGTAGRTTLNGEGLQHQDGHSHLLFSVMPTVRCYDPAFGYEIGTIIRDGIQKMYYENKDIFYYLTAGNEQYPHMAKPDNCEEGILKGLYKLLDAPKSGDAKLKVRLLGSASILNCAIAAQKILADSFGVSAEVYSVTSYTELRREALGIERHNVLNPASDPKKPYITQMLGEGKDGKDGGPVIAASDYMKIMPDSIARWVPGGVVSLGTDGFGRSDIRKALRNHFEVDERYIAFAALGALHKRGLISADKITEAAKTLEIDPAKADPLYA